jgi:type I restriction enzyme S subunit
MHKFSDVFEFHKKSKIKAGDGKPEGKYPFYTSSTELNKYVDDYLFDGKSLVFGTGGNASVHFAQNKFTVSTDCLVAQANTKDVNPKFVYYYLSGNIHILEQGFKGAGLKHISKTYISEITFPKFSRKKQDEIVQRFDTADNLRQKRKEQLALLDDYLKSVFLDMFGDPVINPKKWPIKELGKVGDLDRGISKNRPRNAPELLGGPYPLIQTGDVSNSGGYIKKFKQTYSKLGLIQSKMWPIGTLCITIAANIAKTGILTFEACFPDSVVGFTPNNLVRLEYVQWWMVFLQKILEEKAPESAQKNINLGILRVLDIPVPPIELQNKFVLIVDQVEKTKQKMRGSLDEMNNHFNALMQRYFV